jgi:hypothetical protein
MHNSLKRTSSDLSECTPGGMSQDFQMFVNHDNYKLMLWLVANKGTRGSHRTFPVSHPESKIGFQNSMPASLKIRCKRGQRSAAGDHHGPLGGLRIKSPLVHSLIHGATAIVVMVLHASEQGKNKAGEPQIQVMIVVHLVSQRHPS